MQRPEGLWQQYQGKAAAEIHRGTGWMPVQPHPCALEPPWDTYNRLTVNQWDCYYNDWEAAWDGTLLGRIGFGSDPVLRHDQPLTLPVRHEDAADDALAQLVPIVVEQFAEDESTIPKAEQFLLSLAGISRPIAFEVHGFGPQPQYDDLSTAEDDMFVARRNAQQPDDWLPPRTTVQLVAHRRDAPTVERQLIAHHPNSAIVRHEHLDLACYDLLAGHDLTHDCGFAATLRLESGHCWPLRTYSRIDPDPLAVVIAAMDQLGNYEWALVQVLLVPTQHDWGQVVRQAVVDPYHPDKFLFNDISERLLRDKFSSPLFAVSVRIAAMQKAVFSHLEGWAEQFAAPPQRLQLYGDDERDIFVDEIIGRCTYRPGLLLNLQELSSLVHLPATAVSSERLSRVPTRTRPAVTEPPPATGIVLGENVHRGQRKIARIPPALRPRHCYIAGASGTGKSTLLLNLIGQDIAAGHGVGVLDPHGDLIADVLRRIPANRIDDVILFDPADEEYPFALNIIEAADERERERIVSETLMAFERYFPASWGPRLERILTYAIHTVVDAVPGATLADVERMLTDMPFRSSVIDQCSNPRFVHFWNHEMPLLPKNAADPVLNKLSPFLTSRTVRNIICQRQSAIDFDRLINDGKILLCNLSTGLLTERIAGMFGSFLVTKLVNATFRRARIPEDQRRPFYCYIDEFQAFMNASIGFERILAEARKYKLVLSMANQYVGQLTHDVRQAIFGNVGTFVVFRLGVDDARTVANELGPFTAEEILNLERGQAFARAGGSATSFNLTTYPPPEAPTHDPSDTVVAATRERYAHPRDEAESEFNRHGSPETEEGQDEDDQAEPQAVQGAPTIDQAKRQPLSKKRKRKRHKRQPSPPEPRDPSEDDFVF